MRVGILTFHCADNFGAVLQTYALCQTLTELGCQPCVIDYRPEYLTRPYAGLGRHPLLAIERALRKWRYRTFRRRYIPTTVRPYRNAEQLRTTPPDVDVCICGSDQIWNLRIVGERLDTTFFLDFLPRGIRRVAYAPSTGGTPFPAALHGTITTLLNGFDALSAREQEVRTVIRQLTGRETPLVLDPSLLIENYSAVIRIPRRPPAQFIVVYPLEYSELFDRTARTVQRRLNLPIVNIGAKPLAFADVNLTYLGPSEWLGYMQAASYVCTNSFHGAAYSIIFKRDFLAFEQQNTPERNARIVQLLEHIGLRDRFVAGNEVLCPNSPCLLPVNYNVCTPVVQAVVARSREYLRNAVFARSVSASGNVVQHDR
jgi:hypothetical protein